jgi:ubiquitin-conjugating enzyme E2 J2
MSIIDRLRTKRLNGDLKILNREPLKYIRAVPDENNMLIWYFIIKGPEFSEYNGGYYLGKIIHNEQYPLKPPNFYMLTPSGRFSINKKICLTNSSYHSDQWSAMWNIKTILLGFLSIMLDNNVSGISHINEALCIKKMYANESLKYNRKYYSEILDNFKNFTNNSNKLDFTKINEYLKINYLSTENEYNNLINEFKKLTSL